MLTNAMHAAPLRAFAAPAMVLLAACVLPPFETLDKARCDVASGHFCAANLICVEGVCVADAGSFNPLQDGGTSDAGTSDAGTSDAGTSDAGTSDAGTSDAGTSDAGTSDAGTSDAGTPDAGAPDAGAPDAGAPDAGAPDAGAPDAGGRDAGLALACRGLGSLPTWRQGMAIGEWKQLTTASIAAVAPVPQPSGTLSARIDPSGGLAADTRTSQLYLWPSGGQAYSGNEIYRLDLNVGSPQWSIVTPPTPAASVLAGATHYADGHPANSVTSKSVWFVESTNHLMRFGDLELWGSGATATAVDGWNADSGSYEDAGTYPALAFQPADQPCAKDFANGDVYQIEVDPRTTSADACRLFVWVAATNVRTDLGAISDDTMQTFSNIVVDPNAHRVFAMPSTTVSQWRVFDVSTRTKTNVQLSGTNATAVNSPFAIGFVDPCLGAVVFALTTGEIMTVDLSTYAVTKMTTHGTVPPASFPNAVRTLFQPLPRLGGYAFQPNATSALYFLATR